MDSKTREDEPSSLEIDDQFRRAIRDEFKLGVTEAIVENVWHQLDRLQSSTPTKRTIRQVLQEQHGFTRSELGNAADRSEGQASRYLNYGTLQWPPLAILLTHLRLELTDFTVPFPSRKKRAMAGRIRALAYTKRVLGKDKNGCDPLTIEEYTLLKLMVAHRIDWDSPNSPDSNVSAIRTDAESELDRNLDCEISTEMLRGLQDEWFEAWGHCEEVLEVEWLVK